MYIDTHAHLYLEQFDEDIDKVVHRCKEQRVDKILLPNIDLSTTDLMLNLCAAYPTLFYPMIGLHPCSVKENYKNELDSLHQLVDITNAIAIGEIGTDLYWDKSFVEEQKDALRIQIGWAKAYKLPTVLHCRDSLDMTIEIIDAHQDGNLTGVFHCFGGSIVQAKRIIDLGFYIGIGGVATFKKSIQLRDTLRQIGLDHLVLETDSPYLSPHPYRGKRNESSFIPTIASVVADSCGVSIDDVENKTTKNAKDLFKI